MTANTLISPVALNEKYFGFITVNRSDCPMVKDATISFDIFKILTSCSLPVLYTFILEADNEVGLSRLCSFEIG